MNLSPFSLCQPAALLYTVDKYFIGWFPFPGRQLSHWHKGRNMEMTRASVVQGKCIQITQHQSQYISNTLLYHQSLFAYVSETFTNSILCSYKYHLESGNTLCMHNAAHKSIFNPAVLSFQYKSILFSEWKQNSRYSSHISVNSCN